jgi:hypothetical protein
VQGFFNVKNMNVEAKIRYKQNTLWPMTEEAKPDISAVFTGADVGWLPGKLQLRFAEQISQKLMTKPNTMLQWSAEALLQSMEENRCAIITDQSVSELLAFAHVWPYPYDLKLHLKRDARYAFKRDARYAFYHAHQVLEAGSWLSFKPGGFGSKVMREVVTAGRNYDKDALIIAIVERNNRHAQDVLTKLGGQHIGNKVSPVLKDPTGNNAQMDIFDVTQVGVQ